MVDYAIGPEDYDKPMSECYWEDHFEYEGSPCAKAYRLLSSIDVGPDLESARGPLLEFHEGAHPATAAIGSMQKTNSRCLCCRRG